MMLPQGFSQAQFAKIMAQFRAIVGGDWVFTSDEDLATYRDFYSPFWGEPDERKASGAVAPATVEQVQQIVRIANENHLPLYAFSTGKNLGYGGSAPNLSGCVIVDLKRMNRILKVDEQRQFVLVEPGVTYFDLYRYIQERGLKLWIDCPDPGWGSLVGNSLDHGLGYTVPAMRDHFGAHCGMEIVLPNGELMRTGMGAGEHTDSWQDYRYGFGPYVDGIFSQSNFGIVTKMGFWLYPQPEAALAGTVTVPNYHDIIPLTETLNRLENMGVTNGMPFLFSPLLGKGPGTTPSPQLQQLIAKPGGASATELAAFANGQPYWKARIYFLGPKKVIEAQWEYAKDQFRVIPGATFSDEARYSFPLTKEQIAGLSVEFSGDRRAGFGIPSMEIFMLGVRAPFNPNPSHGHMWLSPLLPRTGEAVIKAQNILLRTMIDLDVPRIDNAPMPQCVIARAYLLLLPFFIREDPAENRRARDAMHRIIDIGAENGWLEYRAHPAFQDQIMGTYSFNNNVLHRFHQTLKDAIDPNGIISPGRYAIWPKTLRGEKR